MKEQAPPEEDDAELQAVLEAFDAICGERGVAFMAAVARPVGGDNIAVMCRGGSPDRDRTNAQMLVVCCEALTELRGLTVEDFQGVMVEEEEDPTYH